MSAPTASGTPEPSTPTVGVAPGAGTSASAAASASASVPASISHAATRSRFGAESPMGLLVENLKDRLLFAVPKKGRLNEKCLELLAGADIKYNRAHRLDVALVQNYPIALVFLPAADIPRFVALGSVALGITGQDMIAESTHADAIEELLPLGFGKCKLQIQVPVQSPYQTAEQLVGKRIATSFEVLAGELFGRLDKEANAAERGERTRVEYVGGSVEAACALGMADGIVDLVESGDTMRAAGLHAIHTLLSSEAVLITSRVPHDTVTPALAPLIPMLRSRMAGVMASRKYVYCSYNIQRPGLEAALRITPGRRAPTVSPLDADGWVAVSAMVEKAGVARVMDELQAVGAEDVLTFALENCRVGA